MPPYVSFAGFYDEIMGDRAPDIERIQGYLRQHLPSARSVLELGCGTGAVLAGLAAAGLEVTGVDQSPQMLALASGNVPQARLVQADMTSFSLGDRFDVIICVFDTLNHLPSFRSWLALFDRVHEHLADDGIFAFDVNTVGRLRRLWQGHAFAQDFGPHTVIMDVVPAGLAPGGGGDLSIWTVRIFERIAGDQFRLHFESIHELGVPLARIRAALAPHFEVLAETDIDGGEVSDESNRVFLAWRHRPVAAGPAL